ncbi:hypothetical protein HPB48_006983 [Haemaphysalis longicornis]|uniref:Uncharacterized protein n=1 Tax=Haemaphysalis longicornis TaxID=44386 RepID=A0A9J6GC13_HAELO|nr:hypothetical protein HPB48_006983 [Haemaphysalis longicornis]
MRGTLSMKRTRAILQKIFDPSNNKTESGKKITKLTQDCEGSELQMHGELISYTQPKMIIRAPYLRNIRARGTKY